MERLVIVIVAGGDFEDGFDVVCGFILGIFVLDSGGDSAEGVSGGGEGHGMADSTF